MTEAHSAYSRTELTADLRTVAIAALASYLAWRWPSNSYLLLLTAVTATLWMGGRLRALLLTLATVGLIAVVSPAVGVATIAPVVKDLPHALLFAAVTMLMDATTRKLRRARREAELNAARLARANQELREQMEEVQTLSESLRDTNDALTNALTDAERTAARASALQSVTAALSLANSVPDVADAVLTRGLHAIAASRGCLALGDDGQPLDIVRSVGYSATEELALRSMTRDAGPLGQAMRDNTRVWFRITGELCVISARPDGTSATASAPDSLLALPLLQGARSIGALTFGFTESAPENATDEFFTALLAQATADALGRARRYDTEREARRMAELTSRAREEVLGVVAHDLRNPLNLVASTAQLLMEPSLPPERRKEIHAISMRAVQRMNRLVGDLLDVVRMETGHLSLEVKPAELNQLLLEAVETLRVRAEERGIALDVTEESRPLVVPLDEGRMMQLVDNLVGNALKFTPRGGRVTVSAARSPADVFVRVADTGPGIPEEQLARLFDRFWQARGTDRRGIGLGLAIARAIAEAHGGRLTVESALGRGSVFQFAMPLAS
jgi:signal transduction histidine kinase